MQTITTDPSFLSRRRARVRQHDELVGLDFIDVESTGPSVFRLHVYFLGTGTRLFELRTEHFVVTPKLPVPLTLIERDIPSSGDARLVFEVRGLSAEMGRYTLRLVPPPGVGVAPFFEHVSFRFDVDGFAVREHRPRPPATPSAVETPPIDYRARDYRGFRSLMLDRIAALIPGRTEHHPADALTMLVELVAHVADQLSYYQDAVATEAYLGTARRRVSIRRHARLLGYFVHEGINARVWVSFRVKANALGPVSIPAGTPVLTDVSPAPPVLSSSAFARALENRSAVVFETMHPATVWPEANDMPLYAWGAHDFMLEVGSTSAYLSGRLSGVLTPGDVIILIEPGEGSAHPPTPGPARAGPPSSSGQVDPMGSGAGRPSTSGRTHAGRRDAGPPSNSGRAHAVRLVAVEASVDPLGEPADNADPSAELEGAVELTHIVWHAQDALPFSMAIAAGGRSRAYAVGNVVLADQGRTIEGEALSPARMQDDFRYRPRLEERNLTFAASFDDKAARARLEPATLIMDTDPREAWPSVQLGLGSGNESDDQIWKPHRDLFDADGETRAFVVEMESDSVAWLRFGDGVYGSVPPARGLVARYRIGSGPEGNIGAGVLSHVVTDVPEIDGVWNPLSARGGAEPETIEQVRIRAPRAHQARLRATTPEDYASLARKLPGVTRAMASAHRGRPVPITLRVERTGRQDLDDAFRDRVLAHLESKRMMGHRLVVAPARYLGIDLKLVATTEPGHRASPVRAALNEAFSSLELEAGRQGFFHPDCFGFGDELRVADIRRQALDVTGVAAATVVVRPWRFDEASAILLPNRVIRPEPDEIIRLDNDPARPEFGSLKIEVREGVER